MKNKLTPTIIQDYKTGVVYMLGYSSVKSLEKTKETGIVYFWSRRKNRLWMKGEESGNKLKMRTIYFDCDNDSVLIKAELVGTNVCHTGAVSCFTKISSDGGEAFDLVSSEVMRSSMTLDELYTIIIDRQLKNPENSYAASLFKGGGDRIIQKIGEEATEVVIAAKNGSKKEIIEESADLFFHMLVMFTIFGITPRDIFEELSRRSKKG